MLEALQGGAGLVDTAKAAVARRALELGAELVNDVTALRGDPELAERRRVVGRLGESIGAGTIVGGVTILAGLWLVQSPAGGRLIPSRLRLRHLQID